MDNVSVPGTPAAPGGAGDVNTAANTQSDVSNAANTGSKEATAQPTKAEAEVLRKIKLGDTEYDEATLSSMIEKAKGADKKFLEASKQKKEAVKFFKLAKENPKEFLSKVGVDFKKMSFDEVAEDIKNKLRDPKEVQIEEAQKKIKEYEDREAARKAEIKRSKEEQAAKAFEQQLHQKMIEALEEAPSLPKNGFTVAKIAKYIETVYNKTGTMLEPKDVVKVIERDVQAEMKGVLTNAEAEKIIALIGEEGMMKIRQYDLARLKDPLKGGTPQGGSDKPKERPRVRSNDFWKEISKAAKEEGFDQYGRRIK